MADFYRQARAREAAGEVLCASYLPVQPWMDFPDVGFTAAVITDDDPAPADAIAKEMGRVPETVRFGIVHVGIPEIVAEVRELLVARYGDVEILSAPVTPVIATHLGVGAWGVAYMVED